MTPSALAMLGSALARIVWSAAARNIASMTPGNTRRNASREDGLRAAVDCFLPRLVGHRRCVSREPASGRTTRSSTKHQPQDSPGSSERITGWRVAWKCLVACLFFELSQHPTCPHPRHRRRCTQVSPIARHSSHPEVRAATSRTGHMAAVARHRSWLRGHFTRGASPAFGDACCGPTAAVPRLQSTTPMSDDVNRDLAQKYDTVAYAAQANAQSHPTHLATVATLLGLSPPAVASARVLEVGCSDGANLLPMAATLPGARFTGCDISGRRSRPRRRGARELGLRNVTFVQADLATLARRRRAVRLHHRARRVLVGARDRARCAARARQGRLHRGRRDVRELQRVSRVPRAAGGVGDAAPPRRRHRRSARAARRRRGRFAALLAEPSVAQTEVDGLLRQELAKLATQTDSALFHDDLARAERSRVLPPVRGASGAPRPRLPRRSEAVDDDRRGPHAARAAVPVHAWTASRASNTSISRDCGGFASRSCAVPMRRRPSAAPRARAAAHARSRVDVARARRGRGQGVRGRDRARPSARAVRRLLQWLVEEAPRIVPVAGSDAMARAKRAGRRGCARPVRRAARRSMYAGRSTSTRTRHRSPPRRASGLSQVRIVRWQAAASRTSPICGTSRMRIDDPHALALLAAAGRHAHARRARARARVAPARCRKGAGGASASRPISRNSRCTACWPGDAAS